MIDKGKISAPQLAMIVYPLLNSTSLLAVPSITAADAKKDLWLSPLWAYPVILLQVWMIFRIYKLYPGKTFSQICEQICGFAIGKLLGLVYIVFYMYLNALILREYADFILGIFLPNTPMTVLLISMLLVSAFAASGGIEVIGRVTQFFFPAFIVPIVFLMVMLIPQMKPANMLPVFDNGPMPSIIGSITPLSWMSDVFIILYLLPHVKSTGKAMKYCMICITGVVLTMVSVNLTTLFVFNLTVADRVYAILEAFRNIRAFSFFEHLESLVMVLWITGIFVKIATIFYVTSIGAAYLLGAPGYKRFFIPVGIVMYFGSFFIGRSYQAVIQQVMTVGNTFIFSLQFGLPLLLLLIAAFKKKKRDPAPAPCS